MRPEHEHDLIEEIAWTIAAGTDHTSATDWQKQGDEYRVEMREGAQAVFTLLTDKGWTPPPGPRTLVTLNLEQETYDLVMRQCAERDVSPGQVIREALRAAVKAWRADQDPS